MPIIQESGISPTFCKFHDQDISAIDFNESSPYRPDTYRQNTRHNSRVGNETLSLQEFKENLGSFEGVFEDVLGNL